MTLRVNCGAGQFPLAGYCNIDEIDYPGIDIVGHSPPLPFEDGEVDEFWACHMLEHLSRQDAAALLVEAHRVLRSGGTLGIVVPDTREIMRRYMGGMHSEMVWEGITIDVADLDDVCMMFLYSIGQESPHQWSYDLTTLRRIIQSAGFVTIGEIDRHADPRLGSGAWYQCGWNAIKL